MNGKVELNFSEVWKPFLTLPVPTVLRDAPGLEIWLANLTPWQTLEPELAKLLDETEQTEVARLRWPADRLWLVLQRGARRILLARYLDCAAAQIRFDRGPFGKPVLATASDLRFNTSRTGAWFCLAVARGVEIGVDIERIAVFQIPPDGLEALCSDPERRQLAALPAARRAMEFLRLWTAKEAVLKLRGSGFTEQADVPRLLSSLRPGERVVEVDAGFDLVAHVAVAAAPCDCMI